MTVNNVTVASSGGLFLGRNAIGSLNLSGGAVTTVGTVCVGYDGVGSVTQSGGLFGNSGGAIYIGGTESTGAGTGSYDLIGGTLSGLVVVGSNGPGTLNQTGGQADVGLLFVGYYAGSAGSVTISGGTFTSTGDFTIGKNGDTSSGTVTLEGTAQCTTSGIRVGENGVGNLYIKDTASLTVNAPDFPFSIASNATSVGYVEQSGGTCSVAPTA